MRAWLFFGIIVLIMVVSACSERLQPSFVQANEVQLSNPAVRVESVFFYDSTQVYVEEPYGDSKVYYEHGEYTITPQSEVAPGQLTVKESGRLRFRTMGGGFIPSEEVEVTLFKIREHQVLLEQATPAKEPYNESTPDILIDHHKASKDFRGPGWLGYYQEVVTFELQPNGQAVKGLALSVLEDLDSWIFAPRMIMVSFYDVDDKLIAYAEAEHTIELPEVGSFFRFLQVQIGEIIPARIKLEVRRLETIPEWHPGSGNAPWLFIDEIVIF